MAAVILINGESPTIVDEVSPASSVTVSEAVRSTAQYKFSTASMYCPSSVAGYGAQILYVSGDTAPFQKVANTLNGSFTFETWVRFEGDTTGTSSNALALVQMYDATNDTTLNLSIRQSVSTPGVDRAITFYDQVQDYLTAETLLGYGAWHHLAITKSGLNVSYYADGALVESITLVEQPTEGVVDGVYLYIPDSEAYYDDICLSNSVKYTGGTYTVPTAPIEIPAEPVAESINAGITLPRLLCASGGASGATISLPRLSVSAKAGANSWMSLPVPALRSTGHDSTGEQAANITLPSLSVAITTGANSKISLPSLSLDAAMTVTNMASAPITLPGLSVASDATVSGMADAAITLPSLSASAYSGALCSVTIGSLTVQATGTTGSVASAQVTLPLMQATAQATANGYGSSAIALPSLSVGSSSRAALTLPGMKLTAIGTATITATYEAYAVNLKHSDPNATDETTHYTNFPFTHVVRYGNSYYGANSTGLYLLEGTTDAGTAIPFDVKTAMTDFKSQMKKTLASAYFSGRFGPASTITLTAGDGTPVAYSFSTPRGQNAQNHRQVFGKGMKERYFALEVAGTGTLELDGIEMDVAKLSRRI